MLTRVTPQEFIAKWKRSRLGERSAYQQHFLDLCELLDQPKPAQADPDGASYTFERGVRQRSAAAPGCDAPGSDAPGRDAAPGGEFTPGRDATSGSDAPAGPVTGWADVWKRGHFGWEYKRKDADLEAAYEQLLRYREDLENPPLLVVCDLNHFQIHTNFTDTVKRVYAFDLASLGRPENLEILRKLFTDPQALRPDRASIRLTEQAAAAFGQLADGMRQRGVAPERAAHFLMKLLFCYFAEDIELLPKDLFTRLIEKSKADPQLLAKRLKTLFEAMSVGGDFGIDTIAWFDGGLFADADVIPLTAEDVERLAAASSFDWGWVEPSIFGTLFLRTLDPEKRAQIGAQYTSKDDILTIVEPVLMTPLRRQWAETRKKCDALWEQVRETSRANGGRAPRASGRTPRGGSPNRTSAAPNPPPAQGGAGGGSSLPGYVGRSKGKSPLDALDHELRDFAHSLSTVRVLDPACGSGNFLYVAIQLLLDLEKDVIAYASEKQLSFFPSIRPTQLHGIEINPYAQQLAQVVIWIGFLQWMKHHGFSVPTDPVLTPIDSIQRMDAIVLEREGLPPAEPEWPAADVIVGNPPFLGGNLIRQNLGDAYVDGLFRLYKDRVPAFADLCCYWFEKARAQIVAKPTRRAGLLATQGIRGGANREILNRVKETGDIFFAISDRDWVLDGANVHVSMVGFDAGVEKTRELDGLSVSDINANLSSGANLPSAAILSGNIDIQFEADKKGGPFEIDESTAQRILADPPLTSARNSSICRPWVNGSDITGRGRGMWIIDFGIDMSMEEAAKFPAAFEYVKKHVGSKYAGTRERWWLHERPRPAMRAALKSIRRYVATPVLTKHRLFVWLDHEVLPDHQVVVFARDDDYFFGVLHSAIHERWSRRMGTQLREAESGCRYTPTTCFETFPFPPLAGGIAKDVGCVPRRTKRRSAAHDVVRQGTHPTSAPADYDPRKAAALRQQIAAAAAKLNDLRENWLNPGGPEGIPAGRGTGRDSGSSDVLAPDSAMAASSLGAAIPSGSSPPIQNPKSKIQNFPLPAAELKKRTLTNLYNERPTWLELAHLDLDRAVLAAYGFPLEWAEKLQPRRDENGKINPILGVIDPAVEQDLLARLLDLNARAAAAAG